MNAVTDLTVAIPGYNLVEQLYCSSRTMVYRGMREQDLQPVVIKLLRREYPTLNELLQFRNQYTIVKNLEIPGIVRFLCLEPYHNSYALVMEDFGSISLRQYAQDELLSVTEVLEIALQLTDILHDLCQNRVIHKDIKPANILIHPQTKQVKLIDFSIASLLPKETQEIRNPHGLEGTLAYLSPEQTGRMNRGIDYRSDFYSFGVTLYELLTGKLPFDSDDPMELVHCHIAKLPDQFQIPNSKFKNGQPIPQILCDIVMKLMAKNAEDRYQSALGLKHDLANCLVQLQSTGAIAGFTIAQRDVSDRFNIPEKLYGRENEVQQLLAAFERVALGNSELMLVAGFSGIGKTAVVNEVHKPIVRQRGYFIKGKFDQFNRNIPFSALVQALRNLMEQILTQSDRQIQQWKDKILAELGENGQVIIEVIPELETIIGTQPPVPELSGTAAQNRFYLFFQKFIQVFTTKEHPLVIFLDDLQWADLASLKLLQLLMSEANRGYLLLIGAYRDNEVSPAHLLMLSLDEIRKTRANIHTMTLQPLSYLKLNQLVADTLVCQEDIAFPLSQLVYQKTQGNPFFSTQFLKALYQDGLIQFNFDQGCWQCDIARVNQQALTDDVVEFMALQLQKLPAFTQEILQLAACIGNQFDLKILAIVSQMSELETAACLWKGLQLGLILPISDIYKFYQESETIKGSSDSWLLDGSRFKSGDPPNALPPPDSCCYKFLHDRVQQAAYSLIPDQQKQATHLQIGQLLQQTFSESEQAEKLFDIVGHLNLGQTLIIQPSDRLALAHLNLKAGAKAKKATAYAAARVYFQTGIDLLPSDYWFHQYELALNLHVALAEASYLTGDFEGMEKVVALVLQQAQTIFDKVKIYEIQIAARTARTQILEASAVGREALSQLGVDLPTEVDEATIGKALQELNHQLQGREIAELIDLPMMSVPTAQAAMQLLGVLLVPVIIGMPGFLPLLGATMVRLSLRFGNASTSTVGYVIHGMVLCNFLSEVETGYRFGRLALSLLERLNAQEMKSTTLCLFGVFIQHRKLALRDTIQTLKEGYTTGMEIGDFIHAAFSIAGYAYIAFFAGVDLDTLEPKLVAYCAALAQVKQDAVQTFLCIMRQMVQQLRETVRQPDCLIGTVYDETVMLPKHQQNNDLGAIACAYIYKLLLAYCFGKYLAALDHITQVKPYLTAVSGMVYIPSFHFYAALTHLALLPTQAEPDQAELLTQGEIHQTILHQWAQNAPMNHLHKWYLVEAERYRVLGEKAAAIECYDRAISLAQEHQFINEAALANELAAKFYLDWGKQRIAQEYMIEAYYGYARWSAKAKVADLEQRYPQLLATILQQAATAFTPTATVYTEDSQFTFQPTSSGSSSSTSAFLDLSVILKASQSLSSEIQLDKLLSALLEIVTATAGADKCVLMLLHHDQLSIEAVAQVGQPAVVLQSIPLSESEDVPVSLVNIVKRTLQPTVIVNATVYPSLLAEPYVLQKQPKSVLCTPILHQGKLLGVLYLENNLATGAFSGDRVELLNLLCTQAAISLENARLYQREQEKSQLLQASLEQLKQIEASLAEEREFLNAIIHNITDGIVVCDASGKLTLFNKATREFHGIPVESLPPEEWAEHFDLYQPDTQTLLSKTEIPLFRAFQGEIVENVEMVIAPKHGCKRTLLASGQAIINSSGNKLGAVVVMRDISDRKIAELALQQKSIELEQALHNLQNAQLQIVQSEKMSALGNLVAGVAHEMNNPLGFIAASLKQAKPTIADLVAHLKLYQQSLPNPSDEIQDHAVEIDLDYSLDDLPNMLDSMMMACDRLKNISTSLRTFSRADQDYKVPFNLHQGLDSTILILKHRLKANEQRPAIEVITNYGNLPQVECFPGQLNQVFMNILSNAIDALDESNNGRSSVEIQANPNRITITTLVVDQSVKISISDNGIGMSESVKQKIFDHLFTTKAVGKGTGLGLAIARQIVEEKHNGSLAVNSTLGDGTEFAITIPIGSENKV